MSSAKPQAVPTGLSMISAVVGSMACFLLLGGITRLRRWKNSSMRTSHSSFERQLDAGGLGRDLLREVVDRGAEAAVDDDGVGALGGQLERQQQALAVVADGGLPRDGEADVLELLAHVAEVGVDDLAGQDLVAGADDLDTHGR